MPRLENIDNEPVETVAAPMALRNFLLVCLFILFLFCEEMELYQTFPNSLKSFFG
jgi:hypothetical protein